MRAEDYQRGNDTSLSPNNTDIKDEKRVRFLMRITDQKLFAGIGQNPLKIVGVFLSEGTRHRGCARDADNSNTVHLRLNTSKLKH